MTRAASVIALAIGDPNGIGPEIAVKAAARLATQDAPRVVLVGDAHVIRWYAQRCALSFDALHVLDVKALPADSFRPGEVSAAAGAATLAYVRAALDLARREEADAVIACPHSETAINASGTAFAGYPGYVAQQLGLAADDVYLLLIGGGLRIVHATLHEGLAGALARLTSKQVEGAARAAVRAMNAMGVDKPRIGVMGINPHAGEGGLFGREDIDVTEPTVATLRDEGIDVVGPQGADLLLTREDIDVFVAMYHDQGHIPVKLRAGRHSAAMSIGGDVVFSSVGHGSGFDIAGRLVADPAPLLGAIGLVTRGESPA
ncbi:MULTISPECIES: PdxA family protein [unclassified Caballeronia]|uniref:PdxA family dehydrogenase n=1 Tax=unclassified Caballeronia TaxID=2646786 RepID=UPI001F487403|nr:MULTISPECIES: 4-hydroxythreonine-4-phosphate dehydrogenase PdxA [unclassified Caballeronia]MCE4546252.1 4-hydroxythreonine-4-phosphate dehydrogenase PdxA [Caballeronia sp. PC1]MCE4573273.1 4-hydroxythreonine-4-phosphate dehydrogenase PdxA [Caballeronia sp. CLC5]